MKRRPIFGIIVLTFLIMISGILFYFKEKASKINPLPTPSAMEKLLEGNERFITNQPIQSNELASNETSAETQAPFAIILGCADSRVSPEIIFDQGLGELFVIRVAGNVAGPIELESIEFAVEKMHPPLLVVLGHENCGAVSAVLSNQIDNNEIQNIAPLIQPAITQSKGMSGDPLTNAIKMNVHLVVESLKTNPVLAKAVSSKKLEIRGAYYDLDTGKVTPL